MRLLSTQGQGAAAYIALPGWTRPASGNWAFGFECRIFSINSEQIILGNSGNNTSLFSVLADGSLKYRDSGVDQLLSGAGVINPNTFYTFVFKRVGSIVELWLGPPGMTDDLVGGTKIGQTSNLTQALFNPVNQFGRYYNSSTNTAIEIKRVWTVGGSYTDGWLPAGVHGTNTGWTSNSLSRFLTITNAAGATNSWWTQYPNASAVSKVGSGWPVDEVEYLTLFHWLQEFRASSVYVEAHCKGEAAPNSITTPTINAADFPVGCLIRGDVVYDGSNHTALTTWARQITVVASSGLVTVQDFAGSVGAQLLYKASISSNNKLKRCYLVHTNDPGSNAAALMVASGAIAEKCVVICTLSTASKVVRPTDTAIVRNCVVIGAQYGLFSEWNGSITQKSYAVGSSTKDVFFQNANPMPPGNITNASGDGTGDVGFQNLSPTANFMDYANGDYRIRASSPLHAAGIGAFFEDVTYIGESSISLEASLNAAVDSTKIGTAVAAFQGGASATLGYSKVSSATASLPSGATMSLAAAKVASGILNLVAGSAAAISSHKVGVATIYMVADATAELYAGNVYIGEGTFTVSAAADISLQGGKVGASPVQFNAAAAAYCAASKQGSDTLSAGAAASGQIQSHKMGQSTTQTLASSSINLDGFKMGAGTPVVLASVSISISGTPAANQTPVALIFVRTSSRYRHNMRTSSRYSYNVRTSSGGARV